MLVYGDTNSTLAGALAAVKLGVPIGHAEAGLRSYRRGMPEEINRVLVDHASDLLLCPSQVSADNLRREGIRRGVSVVGDTMTEVLSEIGGAPRPWRPGQIGGAEGGVRPLHHPLAGERR